MKLIQTETRRVHGGSVYLLGDFYELPTEWRTVTENRQVLVDYHIHLAHGVRIYTDDSTVDCWAPKVISIPLSETTPEVAALERRVAAAAQRGNAQIKAVPSTPFAENTASAALRGITLHSSSSKRGAEATSNALPAVAAVASQNNLLACIEARLTEEVRHLVDALLQFSRVTQAIGKELPVSSEFGKLVTLFLSMGSLHIANALLKSRNKPLLLDDGALQLQELGLSLGEFCREITLDGRKFLAVALTDGHSSNVDQRLKAGYQANEIHNPSAE